VRFVWIYPGALLPFLSRRVRSRETRPTLGGLLLLGWMGMRGGDSLVTALAVPHAVDSGAPFPNRELIIALSFGVIVATMLIQGLTLAPVSRLLRLPVDRSHEKEEDLARREMVAAGDARLQVLESRGLPPHVARRVRTGHAHRSALELALAGDSRTANRADYLEQKRAEEEILRARRAAVVRLRNEQVIDDEVLRHLEQELDLEEMRLALSLGDNAER
jgi:CPA1 family monovalent cation:H+ antiporter